MADPRVILDYVTSIVPTKPPVGPAQLPEDGQPLPPPVVWFGEEHVKLRSDRIGRLYERVLESLQSIGRRAFVEVSESDEVTSLLIPIAGPVIDVRPGPLGDSEIQLENSATLFVLRATQPNAKNFLAVLEEAQISGDHVALVHASGSSDVLFVQRVDIARAAVEIRPGDLTQPAREVLRGISTVPEEGFLDPFVREMQGATCRLPNMEGGCIPFTYALDGCWARAHEMCQRLEQDGIVAAKLWIYARKGEVLEAPTRNLPTCRTSWHFHVAPVVRVSGKGLYVIDPSLFPERAVPRREWVEFMHAVQPIFRVSTQSVYKQPQPDTRSGMMPPPDRALLNIEQDERDLLALRSALILLDVGPPGPPPYKVCLL